MLTKGKKNVIIFSRGDIMELIERKEYVEWLENYKDKKIIKVLTGLRRVGKSTIFDLYIAKLLKSGVEESQIVKINFEELETMNLPIFELCLEQTHINMAITKLLGMIRARKISKVIFASVDKSPHCIQLHYLQDEITKLGFNVEFINYVAVDNKLIKINKETITLSKNLSKLNELV